MITCKKAKIPQTNAIALLRKLSALSFYKPLTVQVWNSLINNDEVAKEVNKILPRTKLEIHDHPSIINLTRFLTSALVLGSGITELTLINLEVELDQLINLVGKLATLDTPPSSEVNSTTKTEHIIHMMCLTCQGDANRIRTGFKHSLNQSN